MRLVPWPLHCWLKEHFGPYRRYADRRFLRRIAADQMRSDAYLASLLSEDA